MRCWAKLRASLVSALLVLLQGTACDDDKPRETAATAEASETEASETSGKPEPSTERNKPPAREATDSSGDTSTADAACSDCNVVLISIDTLRADHMSLYGYDRKTSPNIDKFAARGLVFENAISQSTWTTPSHASMMTGLLPHEHRLLLYPKPGRLDRQIPTIASVLAQAGYKTAAFHGGGYVDKPFGLDLGFDVYRSQSRTFRKNVKAATRWIDRQGDNRFFLFVHGYDVHRPYIHFKQNTFHKPKRKYDMKQFCRYEARVRKGDELAYVVAQYDAGIVFADMHVQRLLAHLDRRGLLERSIVIITSDHGEELFEHGRCDHKHTVYRELVHVPLVVRFPGNPTRRITSQVAASMSLMPTVMGLLGRESPVGAEYDLMQVVNGNGEQPHVFTETGRWLGIKNRKSKDAPTDVKFYKRGLTTPAHKLIYNWMKGETSWELYDVRADPGDQRDLYEVDSPVVKALTPVVFEEGRPALPIDWAMPAKEIDPETAKQLEALGYVD